MIRWILDPPPWIDQVYAQNMYKLPPWAIVAAVEKSVLEYYYSHNKTLAPEFNMYMPNMLKFLDSNMTFTPTCIDFATNNLGSNPEFFKVPGYGWTDIYWAIVEALYDRTFPKITEWHPNIYYERGPLVITESQYNQAVALSNSPKDLLIYAVTQIIRNIRSQWKTEPIILDVIDGIIKIMPADVIFTKAEIEFATYVINMNPETELIYSYQMWYDALSQALSGRIYIPIITIPEIIETPTVETPITNEDRLLETAQQAASETQKANKFLLLAGGVAAIIRIFFW